MSSPPIVTVIKAELYVVVSKDNTVSYISWSVIVDALLETVRLFNTYSTLYVAAQSILNTILPLTLFIVITPSLYENVLSTPFSVTTILFSLIS